MDVAALVKQVRDSKIFKAQQYRWIIRSNILGGGIQHVHTPFSLCKEIIGKLSKYCKNLKKKDILVLFNVEFLDVLINDFGIDPNRLTFAGDSKLEREIARYWYGVKNIVPIDYVDKDSMAEIKRQLKRQFDVVVGNPPYQPPVKRGEEYGDGGSGSGFTLWDKFVTLSLDVLKTDGYLCLVHPAKWRKPEDKLLTVLQSKRILHLDIHNKQEGLKVFGATTRFDWYVLRNKNERGLTTVRDEQGATHSLDLSQMPFIPNGEFELVGKIISKKGREACPILYISGAYREYLPHMSREKGGKFVHPCVNSTGKSGLKCYYSNTTKKGLFGIPKVIFGDADIIANAVVDFKGEYAMTQNAMAIQISSEKEGIQIKKALESEKFNRLLKLCRWSNFRIEWRMFKHFRKDFYLEFLK